MSYNRRKSRDILHSEGIGKTTSLERAYQIKNAKYDKICVYIEQCNFERACELLLDFNSEYPTDVYGQFDYARCLIKVGKEEEGIEILEQLRKKRTKIDHKIYGLLINTYIAFNRLDECVPVIYDAEKRDIPKFEVDMLKVRYYYTLGLIETAEEILKNTKPRSERDHATIFIFRLHNADNDYLRRNLGDIEKRLSDYTKKKYLGKHTANDLFLKLYRACYDNEKAYNYISCDKTKNVKSLIYGYEVCDALDKKEEAQKFLDTLDIVDPRKISDLSRTQILYYHGRKDEAFDACKVLATHNYDAAYILFDWSIQMGRTGEALEMLKLYISNTNVNGYKDFRRFGSILKRIVSLHLYHEEYEEAYTLFINNKVVFNEFEKELLLAFLGRKGFIQYTPDDSVNTYCLWQLRDYNLDNAIMHIGKHKYRNMEKAIHTVFTDDIPIHDLIDIIKPHLTKENLYDIGTIDKYEIDCSELNIKEKKLVVGTIGGEDNILFAFPSRKLVDIDNLEIKKEEQSKVKCLTGLDRFNLRYGKYNQN